MAENKKKIFILLPISEDEKERQRKRAEELAHRVRCKGFEAVNPFDISDDLDEKFGVAGNKPCWLDYVAEEFRELMECDGILLDIDVKTSYVCNVLTAAAQAMVASKSKRFNIYHTKEQWREVNNRYIL